MKFNDILIDFQYIKKKNITEVDNLAPLRRDVESEKIYKKCDFLFIFVAANL